MKIISLITIIMLIIITGNCAAQQSRIDLGYTILSTFSSRTVRDYFTLNKTETSSSETKTGIILTYRYKIDIFSSLELGLTSGYHFSEYHYSGLLFGVDLNYNFWNYFFVELSTKYILAGGNRGSTHNPNNHNDYTLHSIGIGKDIWKGLGIAVNFYKPASSYMGDYDYQHGQETGYEKLDNVYSVKMFLKF